MKTSILALPFFLISLFIGVQVSVLAQTMHSSKEQNVKFHLPAGWKVTRLMDGNTPYLHAQSTNGILNFYVFTYQNSEASAEDLFGQMMGKLKLKVQGGVKQEVVNGITSLKSEGTCTLKGVASHAMLISGSYQTYNFLAYTTTPENQYEANITILKKMLNSLSPLN